MYYAFYDLTMNTTNFNQTFGSSTVIEPQINNSRSSFNSNSSFAFTEHSVNDLVSNPYILDSISFSARLLQQFGRDSFSPYLLSRHMSIDGTEFFKPTIRRRNSSYDLTSLAPDAVPKVAREIYSSLHEHSDVHCPSSGHSYCSYYVGKQGAIIEGRAYFHSGRCTYMREDFIPNSSKKVNVLYDSYRRLGVDPDTSVWMSLTSIEAENCIRNAYSRNEFVPMTFSLEQSMLSMEHSKFSICGENFYGVRFNFKKFYKNFHQIRITKKDKDLRTSLGNLQTFLMMYQSIHHKMLFESTVEEGLIASFIEGDSRCVPDVWVYFDVTPIRRGFKGYLLDFESLSERPKYDKSSYKFQRNLKTFEESVRYYRLSGMISSPPAARLVGIELNPGPMFSDLKEYPFVCQFIRKQGSNVDITFSHFLASEAFLNSYSRYCGWDVSVLRLCAAYHIIIKPHLVGVETNPGPAVLSKLHFSASVSRKFEPQMFNMFGGVELGEETRDVLNDLVDALHSMSNSKVSVDVTSSGISELISSFTQDPLIVKVGCSLFISLLFCIWLRTGDDKYKILTVATATFLSLKYGESFFSWFVSNVGSYVPQMDTTSALLDMLLCAIYFWVFGKKNNDIGKTFISSLSDLPRARDGMDFYFDRLYRAVQLFVNHLFVNFGKEPMFQPNARFPELDEIQSRFMRFVEMMRNGGDCNYDNSLILYGIERDLIVLNAKIPSNKENSEYKKTTMILLSQLKPYLSKFERNNVLNNGPRKEPFGILVGGPTGVGKSTSAIPLMLAIMCKVLPKDKLESFLKNHNDHIWSMVPENEYSDSYHGQFATFYDESGALRDSVGSPDPGSLMILRMINTVNYPLHMADLADKGNTNFSSRLVFATTNRNFFKWEAMVSSEAFVRRFRLQLVLVPKTRYCMPGYTNDIWTRRLDPKLIPVVENGLTTDIYEFHSWDFVTGTKTGKVYTFEEVIDLASSEYFALDSKSQRVLDFNSLIKEKYKPQMFDAVCDAFKSNTTYKVLGALVSGLAVGYLVWNLVRPVFFPQSFPKLNKRTTSQKKDKGRKSKPHKKLMINRGLKRTFQYDAQDGVTKNLIDMCSKVYRKNLYSISYLDKSSVGFCLFVRGRLACVPAHFISVFDDRSDESDDFVLTFSRVGASDSGFSISYEDITVVRFDEEDNDVAYLLFPEVVHAHPDITKLFLSSDDLPKVPNKFSSLIMLPRDGTNHLIQTKAIFSGSVDYGETHINKSITYPVQTATGDCGSPIFLVDRVRGVPKILGVHTAGNGTSGVSNVMVSDDIDHVINSLDDQISNDIGNEDLIERQMADNFLVLGKVKSVRAPTKTQVCKSLMDGALMQSKCAPAMLARSGDIDPWINARSKYSKKAPKFDLKLLDACANLVSKSMRFASVNEDCDEPTLLTFDEAVKGVPGVKFLESLPRNTSPGYPYICGNKQKGKTAWFGDEEFDLTGELCEELKDKIYGDIAKMENLQRCEYYYVDYLKDERRPIAKALSGSTRLISACPMDYMIACRMYFGDFVRWCMSNNVYNSMAIGCNPYSSDWNRIAEHLSSLGSRMVFGDYKGYDGSLAPAIEYSVLSVIEDYYYNSTQEERNVRKVLFEDIVNSRHIVTGANSFAYEWFGSNPSGNFLTTILNSVANNIILRYTLTLSLARSNGYFGTFNTTLNDFLNAVHNNIRTITFGDDNGIGFSDDIEVDLDLWQEVMLEHGFTYTNENKDDTCLRFKTLEECSFLKRGFHFDYDQNRYLAPLDIDVILEMLNWTRTNAPPGSIEQTIDTCALELSLHGQDTFNRYISTLKRESNARVGHVISPKFSYHFDRALHCEGFY